MGLVYFEVLEVLGPRSVDIRLQRAPVAGPPAFTTRSTFVPGSSQFALPLQPPHGVVQNSIKFDGVIRAILRRNLPLCSQDFLPRENKILWLEVVLSRVLENISSK